jgi:hypothetical protein
MNEISMGESERVKSSQKRKDKDYKRPAGQKLLSLAVGPNQPYKYLY